MRIIPLGGLGEVGMNCLAIEHGQHRLLVDCGVIFPDQPFGTDVIRPSFRYLTERPMRSALWITHGHEDHIGAVPYLLREHPMRVYAPPYARHLIDEKLEEYPLLDPPEIIATRPGRQYEFGPFQAEPIRVTHSIADATSLALRTPAGLIIHTGDFKIDPEPPDGEYFDRERFRALGDEGVRLLLSDSTNVDSEGEAGSESDVGDHIGALVERCTQRVVVVLFASNTHRLRAMVDIARSTGRKLCWLGRSVMTHARVARETGYLDDADDVLIKPELAAQLPRGSVLIAATGSQGEPPSALGRLARRAHPTLALERGDTVIMSSRVIPGNDRDVISMLNQLERQGVEVIERRGDSRVHVSGHAHRGEQRAMLSLVRPHAFIPVHGTFHHLRNHAALARQLGVAQTLLAENGDVIELGPESLDKIEEVETGRVHVSRGLDVSAEVLDERARLAAQGAVAISFTVDSKGRLLGSGDVTARGVVFRGEAREILEGARHRAKRSLYRSLDQDPGDLDAARDSAQRALVRFFADTLGQRVVCMVLVNMVRT